jgi:hypothetical protein
MDVVVDEVEGSIPCDMCMQGGGASTKKICCLPDAFVPGQYVTNHIDIKEENEPADKAEVPIALSFVRMNVVCGSHENHEDVSCAFHATLYVHGLCRVSNKKSKRTYAHLPHGLHHQVPWSPHTQHQDRQDPCC